MGSIKGFVMFVSWVSATMSLPFFLGFQLQILFALHLMIARECHIKIHQNFAYPLMHGFMFRFGLCSGFMFRFGFAYPFFNTNFCGVSLRVSASVL